MSKPKTDKFMGLPLGDPDSESDSDSASGSGAEDKEEEQEVQLPVKKKKVELSLEDLERAGYKSGPSMVHMKAPAAEEQQNWNWGKGNKDKQEELEDDEDRAATREAIHKGVEESAVYAIKSVQYANKLRDEAKAEREQLAREKKLSFNQKEKRKRDTGQASRGKSYVEESKRQARDFGVYSGFD